VQDCAVTLASTFVGKSGAAYSFAEIEQASLKPQTAGNFVYVRQDGDTRIVLFVGDSEDLPTEAGRRWTEAVSLHGATHLFVRRIVTSRVRQEERDDLVRIYAPIMNVEVKAETRTGG
jgi:hypothetical protein